MIFAVPIGYSLSEDSFRGNSLAKTIIDIPIAFPEILLGLMLLMFFGMFNIGNEIVFTKVGIICAQFFVALPYAIKTCYSTFSQIDSRLKFVSRSLGHSEFDTFLNVVLPLSKKGLFASLIISFLRCIGSFGAVLILGGGVYQKTDTLPVSLYLNLSYGNIKMAITSAIILMLLSFITIFVIEKMEVHL
ncbi:ABC transporter permease [Methanothermobacter wolfeii]|uniref:ABC transporter permease n=1 Tax=Methanothermobacter wolfeii TaxID=145261 RepID=UPI0024B38ABB|nr:ABC transporter permease [Methanothermobacter wolfeii]MDI6703008.1 ABC transporter permease [Methanothermobacter wolfeii]